MPAPAPDPRRLDRRRRRARRHGTLVAVLVVGLVVLARAAYVFLDVYAAVIDDESIALLDEPTLRLAMEARSPWLDTTLTVYTNVAGVVALPILALLVIVVLAVRRCEWLPVVLGLPAGTGSLLIAQAGKELFGRDRPRISNAVPPYETSASFPLGPRAERHGRRRHCRLLAGAAADPEIDAGPHDHGDLGVGFDYWRGPLAPQIFVSVRRNLLARISASRRRVLSSALSHCATTTRISFSSSG